MFERIFHTKESGSSLGNEAIGGCTTFLTMAYIIFVQPAVLSMAGMDFGAVMVGTCISSAIATFLMGFLANYPVALAPGMGENFFFVFNVVIGMSIAWPEALGAVFIAGLLFILLTILQVRKFILNVIPDCLKAAIPAAIGLFIAFIGMVDGGIVAKHPAGGYCLDWRSSPSCCASYNIRAFCDPVSHGTEGSWCNTYWNAGDHGCGNSNGSYPF